MNRTRPKQIVIRVSEEELAQIKEKVEQSGKSQQQYIIEALTQSNIVNLDGLKEIYPELKRQGNNLNQIAVIRHLIGFHWEVCPQLALAPNTPKALIDTCYIWAVWSDTARIVP